MNHFNQVTKNKTVTTNLKIMAKVKTRTDADLKGGGQKGKVVLVARKAIALAKKDKYEGIPALKGIGYPTGLFYRTTQPDGALDMLKTDSDKFKSIVAAGNSAIADVVAQKYTDKVKNFLNEVLSVKAPRGERGVNIESLRGMTI